MNGLYCIFHFLSQFCDRSLFSTSQKCLGEISQDISDFDPVSWDEIHWFQLIEHFLKQSKSFQEVLTKIRFETRSLAQYCFTEHKIITQNKAKLLLYSDALYPKRLRLISDPPLGLCCFGDLQNFCRDEFISVVGSRKSNNHALKESYLMGLLLQKQGYCVVSGGAYGCDIAAHQGALAAHQGGMTDGKAPFSVLVIFAGGLGNLYPHGNRETFRRIINQGGCFVSERLWNHKARPHDFPIRNRIISGISSHTLVMYAGEKSGAMLTAQIALDQGREIFVMNPHFLAKGSLDLEEQGAQTFWDTEDFFNRFICQTGGGG